MADEDKPASAADDSALIAEAKKRLSWAIEREQDNRDEARRDLEFLVGNQWDAAVLAQRKIDRRPAFTINRLPAILSQVTNDQRQNKPSIKVHAVDSTSDVEVAEVLQGLIRAIEYGSGADVAYDTAINSAASCGFGFFRLTTDYVSDDSFDQEIRFKRVSNAFTVYPGPHSEPDGSDMPWCLLFEDMPRDEFAQTYPRAKAQDVGLDSGAGDVKAGWIGADLVRVAEYYRIEHSASELWLMADGSVVWRDEAPKGAKPMRKRAVQRKRVAWYKLTGAEVLERTEVPCDWIPVFPVYGSEVNVDGKCIRWGVIRNARDPSYLHNLWLTTAAEEIALRPKVPYIGAEGQFTGHEKKWREANTRNFPYLEYRPKSIDGQLAPPPSRQPMSDVPAGALQMVALSVDNIKAVTGLYDASMGAQGNETSGRAIIARQREGDTANFHFADNLARSIRHAGRCIISMIPRVYDTRRVVRILGEDERPETVEINAPQPAMSEDGQAIERVLNDLTVGRYDVAVSMGPSYTTQRQEAVESMVQLAQAYPPLMEIAGDKIVRNMDWPGADDIAKRMEKRIPPELRDDEEQQQIPPAVQAAIQQLQGYAQQLEGELQEAQSGLAKARIDAQAKVQVAQIGAQSASDVAELKGAVSLLVERVQAMSMGARPLSESTDGLRAQMKAEDPMTTLGPILTAINGTAQALESAARRMTARRRLVTDPDGNPIGVEIEDDPQPMLQQPNEAIDGSAIQ